MLTFLQEARQREILTLAHLNHEKKLNAHAFFKTHNRAVSEGLVQDTFLKTWLYLIKGGEIDIMKAFLYRILNNLIVDEYRKHKTTSLDILLENGFEPSAHDSGNLFQTLDGKAAILLIQYLPEKYQKIMRMRYVEDLSLKEISLITKQSNSTTAVQAHRGLEKLRLLYKLT